MDLVHSGFTTSVRAELRDEKLFNALLFDNGNRQLKLDLRPTQRRHSAFPVPFTKVQYGVCSGRSYSGNSSLYFHPISVSSRAFDDSQGFPLGNLAYTFGRVLSISISWRPSVIKQTVYGFLIFTIIYEGSLLEYSDVV